MVHLVDVRWRRLNMAQAGGTNRCLLDALALVPDWVVERVISKRSARFEALM